MDSVTREKVDCLDSLRISPQEQSDILSELDNRAARQKSSERRIDQRLRFVQQVLLFIQVRHPGGTVSNYLVRTRNLSKTGIGFLHGTFLYSGTPCTLSLKTADHKFIDIEGAVVRCSHVRGHIHDVGVKFNKPVKLRDFVGRAAPVAAEDAASSELPQLSGKVLHIEDSADSQDLLKFHLDSVGVAVETVSSGMDALEIASSVKFDLIIMGVWLAGMSGPEIAQALRQGGYQGPIIAITADERDETRVEALERGCTALLTTPYRFEELLTILLRYLPHGKKLSTKSEDTIISELWADKLMRPLISRFVGRLDGQLKQIANLVGVAGTEPLIQKLCMDLKGSAGGYGFPQISKAAHAVLELTQSSTVQVDEIRREMDALSSLCTSATRSLETAGKTTEAKA